MYVFSSVCTSRYFIASFLEVLYVTFYAKLTVHLCAVPSMYLPTVLQGILSFGVCCAVSRSEVCSGSPYCRTDIVLELQITCSAINCFRRSSTQRNLESLSV